MIHALGPLLFAVGEEHIVLVCNTGRQAKHVGRPLWQGTFLKIRVFHCAAKQEVHYLLMSQQRLP